MKYELEFVKIIDQHEYAGVGFAGNIFITLNALTHISPNDKLIVNMEKQDCVCTERNSNLYGTENCWEYYFDQETIQEGEEVGRMNSLISANLKYDCKDNYLDPQEFSELKKVFFNSFKLKQYLVDMLDDYYNKNIKDKVTLGVQIRLTDMRHHHKVSPSTVYINRIKDILADNPLIQQVFLATDDSAVIDTLREHIHVPVICYENMFRADAGNLHLHPYDRYRGSRPYHKYQLGVECIQEIFTLAKCDYLLKADISAISVVASILSENIKTIYKL
jgi:hypothetical protein